MYGDPRVRLSLSGFLFEDDYATQSLPLEEFCRLARECGYAGVELRQTQIGPGASAVERAHVKHVLTDFDLSLTCLTMRHPPSAWAERDAYLQRYLDLCLGLECPLLKVSGSTDWLSHATDLAKPFGVRLATNNHIGTVTESISGTDALLRSIPHENFGLLFDPMHLFVAGEDPLVPVVRWSPRIFNVLFQCVRETQPQEQEAFRYRGVGWTKCHPTERGAPPWRDIAQSLVRNGYAGWITVIENAWPGDERGRIAAEAAKYLESIFQRTTPDRQEEQ